MKKSVRPTAEPDPAAAAPEREPDDQLDTGHPAWIRAVTLVILAVFLLATVVAALM